MREFFLAAVSLDLKRLFKEKTENSFIQFFRYIFVGGFAFLADAFSLWFCEIYMHYMISAAVGFIIGLIVNYLLSTCFVFGESAKVKNKLKEFAVYALIGIMGLALTEIIMYFLTDICNFYFMLSKIAAAVIVLLWNFAARKVILYNNCKEVKK